MLPASALLSATRPLDPAEEEALIASLSPETMDYIRNHWTPVDLARLVAYRRAYQAGFITDDEPGA